MFPVLSNSHSFLLFSVCPLTGIGFSLPRLASGSAEGGSPCRGLTSRYKYRGLAASAFRGETGLLTCLFSRFLHAACGGAKQEKREVGAQPQTPGQGLAALDNPAERRSARLVSPCQTPAEGW